MLPKRKHKTLSIKDKNEIIQRLCRGENQTKLADEYGIGRATVYNIYKNRAKIEAFISTAESVSGKRQTLKKAEHPEVEEAVYAWYLHERRRRAPITGPLIVSKAKYFYKQITKRDDFVASKGWLGRFKNRHGIRLQSAPTHEKPPDRASDVDDFLQRFLQKIEDLELCPSQVYHANECGLRWRVASREPPGRKTSTERIAFLPCANASGLHKLKLLVVGEAEEPRALENARLPIHYRGRRRARIRKDLFKKWFRDCFVPEVKIWLKERGLPRKALLLLEGSPAHPTDEELTGADECVTAMFLPTDATASLRPMGQNVMQLVKRRYKNNLLVTAVAKDQAVEQTLKEFDVKDMAFALARSWRSLSVAAIVSSWKNAWPDILELVDLPESQEAAAAVDDDDDASENLRRIATDTKIGVADLQEWYDELSETEVACLSDEELTRQACDEPEPKVDVDVADRQVTVAGVSTREVVESFDVCLKWAEENDYSCSEVLLLRRMREAALSRLHNIKQEIN